MSVERSSAQTTAATSREAIVAAAMKLADAEGLEAVSMRRLAEGLGVATMTLYTYVESKDELIELMRDEVARAMLVPEPLPSGWREALRQIAHRTRDAMAAHPWAVASRSSGRRVRINLARHIEQSGSVAETIGAEPRVGVTAITAVDDYVIGHCLRLRSREQVLRSRRAAVAAGEEPGPAIDPEVEAGIESGELARVGRLFAARAESGSLAVAPEPDFEQGLEWLLDGIEAMAAGGEPRLDALLLDGTDSLADRERPR